jgi:hypothetical protein
MQPPGLAPRVSTRAVAVVSALTALVALAAAASNVRDYARYAWGFAREPQPLVRSEDVDPLAYFVPTAALVGARATIPPGATYAIVSAKPPTVADPNLVRIVFRAWLLPRRYVDRPADADWVIGYRVPSETLGVPVTDETGVAPSIQVVRVRR